MSAAIAEEAVTLAASTSDKATLFIDLPLLLSRLYSGKAFWEEARTTKPKFLQRPVRSVNFINSSR
jgi:hypothetical protein